MIKSLKFIFLSLIVIYLIECDETGSTIHSCGPHKQTKKDLADKDYKACKGENGEYCCYVNIKNFAKPHCTKLSGNVTDQIIKEISRTIDGYDVDIKCP